MKIVPPGVAKMEWSRPVPEAWERRLYDAFRPEDAASWLVLRWEPGEEWHPINRWVLWHVRRREDAALFYPDHLAELEGPDPRATGHACFPGWCMCDVKRNRWYSGSEHGPAFIDRGQWQLYRDTGLFGTRYWCIQGDNGGNRWSLSPFEEQMMQFKQLNHVLPGDAAYADFDERVIKRLRAYDRIREASSKLEDASALERLISRSMAQEREQLLVAAREHVDREYETQAEFADMARSVGLGRSMSKEERLAFERENDADVTRERLANNLI